MFYLGQDTVKKQFSLRMLARILDRQCPNRNRTQFNTCYSVIFPALKTLTSCFSPPILNFLSRGFPATSFHLTTFEEKYHGNCIVAQSGILFERGQSLTSSLVQLFLRFIFEQLKIDIKHRWKILASLFGWRLWPLWPHSGCVIATVAICVCPCKH